MEKLSYSIIGAGIGGLAIAVAFENAGIPYQVFEKAPELNEVGAGIWLAPNALKVLENLGVLAEVKAQGRSMKKAAVCKQDLTVLTSFSQNDLEGESARATIAIHRAKLQQILFKQIPSSKIHLGKGFESYRQIGTESIEVTFNDGSTTESNYLIGADGINSGVRHQLFPGAKKRYSGQTCWRGISHYPLEADFANLGLELWGNQVRFGLSGIDTNRVYWFAVALDTPDQKDDPLLVKEKLHEMFSEFHPLVNKIISATSTDQVVRNDIYDLAPLPHWYEDTICLIGDAAHATTPNMGQGGAQAIEDAYYLSNLITQHPEKNVFALFQQKREKKVKAIVKQSWTTGKMAHWKYGRGLRNMLFSNVPKAFMKKKLMELYEVEDFLPLS